jgi:hypothetical protein
MIEVHWICTGLEWFWQLWWTVRIWLFLKNGAFNEHWIFPPIFGWNFEKSGNTSYFRGTVLWHGLLHNIIDLSLWGSVQIHSKWVLQKVRTQIRYLFSVRQLNIQCMLTEIRPARFKKGFQSLLCTMSLFQKICRHVTTIQQKQGP